MKNFIHSRSGSVLLPYALLISLIALLTFAAVSTTGHKISAIFNDSSIAIAAATAGDAPSYPPAPPGNRSPVITTSTVPSVIPGESYSFGFSGMDPDNDTITWSSPNVPTGLELSPEGLLSGAMSVIGHHNLHIVATDPYGASTSSDFNLSVSSCVADSETFTTPGNYSWVMPVGCRSLTMEVAGAFGGQVYAGEKGGFGGLTNVSYNNIPPSQQFYLHVGSVGTNTGTVLKGSFRGGGYSAVFSGSALIKANTLVMSGGGGGAGYYYTSTGGKGGANGPGGNGSTPYDSGGGSLEFYYGGFGGTLTAGGAPGYTYDTYNGGSNHYYGNPGVSLSGGAPGGCNANRCTGGGGGDGWFGGGSSGNYSPGGGGSGYVAPELTVNSAVQGGSVSSDGYIILSWSE